MTWKIVEKPLLASGENERATVSSFDVSASFERSLRLHLDLSFENYSTFFVDPVFPCHDNFFSNPIKLDAVDTLHFTARRIEAAVRHAESQGP